MNANSTSVDSIVSVSLYKTVLIGLLKTMHFLTIDLIGCFFIMSIAQIHKSDFRSLKPLHYILLWKLSGEFTI